MEKASWNNCPDCPHVKGDSYQRDCDFPHCMGWIIKENLKPIPDRRFDWDFYHPDYDGCDGGNGLSGNASSYQDAVNQITEIISNSKD